jgi:hypothetical protein
MEQPLQPGRRSVSAQVIRFCDYRRVRAGVKPRSPAEIIILPVIRVEKAPARRQRPAAALGADGRPGAVSAGGQRAE